VHAGATSELRGAAAVARSFSGRARFAQPVLVNGAAGLVWAPGGHPQVVFGFGITGGKITAIDLVADPERLGRDRPDLPQGEQGGRAAIDELVIAHDGWSGAPGGGRFGCAFQAGGPSSGQETLTRPKGRR
jgi:hypothetical protein